MCLSPDYQIQTEELHGLVCLAQLQVLVFKNKTTIIMKGVMTLPNFSALLCSFVDYRPSSAVMSGDFASSRSTLLWIDHNYYTPDSLAKA